MKDTVKQTPCGNIEGLDRGEYLEFRGIKYATAKRWEYPTEVTAWDGTYDATQFGACSYQRRGFDDDAVTNPFYHIEFRKGLTFTYSEDCLYLNIYAPKQAQNCPVVIYIHGGSFTGGSADEGHIRCTAFAKRGVIYVAMNYRLGPYGFCSHPDLIDKSGAVGNYGLYDQFTAIEWVRHNIAAFGGNPDDITLVGQSAGAMSVDLQISNPAAQGYYKGAILMSGAALQRGVATIPLEPEKTRDFWEEVVSIAGYNTIFGLQRADERTLFFAWLEAQKKNKLSLLYTLPVYDGKMVTRESFNMNTLPCIPYMIGVTTADMAAVALQRLAINFGKAAMKNGAPCYMYNFARDLPGDDIGAWHACDLLYAFDTLDFNWRPFDDTDRRIANEMVEAFVAFARTGNPNCDAIPKWESGVKMPLRFCEHTAMAPWLTKDMIKNTVNNKGPI